MDQFAQNKPASSNSDGRKKRVALLVPNPCNPDNRVIKLAHLLALDGHDVRVYCRARKGLPMLETINGVTYVRRELSPLSFAAACWRRLAERLPLPSIRRRTCAKELAKARAANREEICEIEQ
jgi:hypothetical protein